MGYEIRGKSLKGTQPFTPIQEINACSLVGRGDKGAGVLETGPVVSVSAMLKSFSGP